MALLEMNDEETAAYKTRLRMMVGALPVTSMDREQISEFCSILRQRARAPRRTCSKCWVEYPVGYEPEHTCK